MAKVKRYTKRQLSRLRVQREREAAKEQKELRARMYRALRPRRADYAFRGCDPQRFLDLIGEDY